YVTPIISAGAWTVFVQIIYTAKMNIPTMIISASLGLLAVAEYSVAQKLIGLAAAMIGMALQPLWVVYGEAYHRGDRAWVENTLKKSIKLILLLTVLAAVAFQFVGQPLISLWLGGEIVPSRLLIGCFSLWMIASTVNICFAMLLNGTGNFKNQAVFSAFFVGLALILIAVSSKDIGAEGVIFVMFFVAELMCIPLYYFESRRVIMRLNYEAK
ncbi:MAG: oligosaccharide flippase family protein, partial [Colwellia sp.]